MKGRPLTRIAVALSLVSALGACASIPQRAWDNGQALSQSRAAQSASRGDMSVRTHRELYSTANPLFLRHREVPYPAFGNWWY